MEKVVNSGVSPSPFCLLLVNAGHKTCRSAGKEQHGGFAVSLLCHQSGKILEFYGPVAKDIAFPFAPFVQCSDTAGSQIPYIAEIESTVDAQRHLTVDDFDHGAGGLANSIIFWPMMPEGWTTRGALSPFGVQHPAQLGWLGPCSGCNNLGPSWAFFRFKMINFRDLLPFGQFGDCASGADIDQLTEVGSLQTVVNDVRVPPTLTSITF